MARPVVIFFVLMSIVAQAIAQDAAPSVVEIIAPDGRKLSFGVDEILEVSVNANKNFNQITFQVDDTTGKMLATLTAENIGKQITIRVCGEEVSAPIVHSAIFEGGMALAGFTKSKAKEVGDMLSGRISCF